MPNLIDRLKREESLRLEIYDDATGRPFKKGDTLEGNLTVGYGCNVMKIDTGLADTLLDYGIQVARWDAYTVFLWSVFYKFPITVQEVFLDMLFQMGRSRFATFQKMIAAAKAHDWVGVKREMLDSEWARGKHKARAERLAALLPTEATK